MKNIQSKNIDKPMVLSVVGHGFVGSALAEGMKTTHPVHVFDNAKPEVSTVENLEELVENSEIIFVCVPTPMFEDGMCDISIVEDVVRNINLICMDLETPPIVVIKSTIPPGTVDYLSSAYENITIIFNPEFLKEASPFEDFVNQDRIILGGDLEAMSIVGRQYRIRFPNVPVVGMEARAAEMVKYVINCYLATKVSFFNEVFQICDKLDVSYDGVVSAAKLDKRLGDSHMQVPGPMPDPDGNLKPGFSGSCFVKDINAFMFLARHLGVDPKVMNGAWQKNLEVRPERDWEQLEGRAVVEKKIVNG